MKKDEKECRSLCRELLTEKRKLKTITMKKSSC